MLLKLFLFLLFCTYSLLISQTLNYNSSFYLLKNNRTLKVKQNNRNLRSTNNQPKVLIPLVIGSVILTEVLLATDNKIYSAIRKFGKQNNFIKNVSPIITNIGDGKFSLVLFGGMGAYYFLSGNRKVGNAALLGIESFLLSGVTVQILKHTFGRERPSHRTLANGKWSGPYISHKEKSIASFDAFPSGHTATAFAAASSLSYVYPDGIVPYVSYGIASLVALSRIVEDTHWLSDCFIGGVVGYLSTQFIHYLYNRNSMFRVGMISNDKKYVFIISSNLR